MGEAAFRIASFVEKPALPVAWQYVTSGEYDWNSGLFLFRASRYLAELQRFRPDILAAFQQALVWASTDLDFIRVDAEAFRASPNDSIDYAVTEKTDAAMVVRMDADGNAHRGDVLSHDSRNTLVFAENALVTTVGQEDVVVVQAKDAVPVAARDRVQEVKQIVNQLKAEGRS